MDAKNWLIRLVKGIFRQHADSRTAVCVSHTKTIMHVAFLRQLRV
jgi:hypothetical protein